MNNFEKLKSIDINGFKPFEKSSIDDMVGSIYRMNCNCSNSCKDCVVNELEVTSCVCKDKIRDWLKKDESVYYFISNFQLNKMKELLMENEFDKLNEFFNEIEDQKVIEKQKLYEV